MSAREQGRARDGSAGDADYARIGGTYTDYRRPDPRLAAAILAELGGGTTLINVGAGAGSYEPTDRAVTPVEPSASMRAKRPAHLAPAVDATAEALPFADDSFDAGLATFTVHQWRDLRLGLGEMRRVVRGPVVIMTCDPAALDRFWLDDYAPEVIATEARRYPALDGIADALGGRVRIVDVPIPLDCTDGFQEAYYGRPEMILDAGARLANSAWSFVGTADEARAMERLAGDLADGTWDRRHGHLRTQPSFHGALRLVVGEPG